MVQLTDKDTLYRMLHIVIDQLYLKSWWIIVEEEV